MKWQVVLAIVLVAVVSSVTTLSAATIFRTTLRGAVVIEQPSRHAENMLCFDTAITEPMPNTYLPGDQMVGCFRIANSNPNGGLQLDAVGNLHAFEVACYTLEHSGLLIAGSKAHGQCQRWARISDPDDDFGVHPQDGTNAFVQFSGSGGPTRDYEAEYGEVVGGARWQMGSLAMFPDGYDACSMTERDLGMVSLYHRTSADVKEVVLHWCDSGIEIVLGREN